VQKSNGEKNGGSSAGGVSIFFNSVLILIFDFDCFFRKRC
jgi:hypothetical protein